MDSKELIKTIEQYAAKKNINKEKIGEILKEVFSALIEKEFGTTDKFSIVVNPQKGDLQIFRTRKIVANSYPIKDDPNLIFLDEARKIADDFELGEEVDIEIPLDTFKLRAQRKALQVFRRITRQIEDLNLYQKYVGRIGQNITVEVFHQTPRYTIVRDSDHNELILPNREKIPKDRFYIGQEIKVVLSKVEKQAKGMVVVVSRTSPLFLRNLLFSEISEVSDGHIEILKIVRRAGERSKILVHAEDDRIQPVGAIIGRAGSRIESIKSRICYESIDVVQYTDNPELLVRRSLAPARLKNVIVEQRAPGEKNRATVYLEEDQMPLAVGSKGQNIHLACELTEFEITLHVEEARDSILEDVALDDFKNEIEPEVLTAIKLLGLTSGRDVLKFSLEQLQKKLDLPLKDVKNAYQVIEKEFQ